MKLPLRHLRNGGEGRGEEVLGKMCDAQRRIGHSSLAIRFQTAPLPNPLPALALRGEGIRV